MTSESPRKVRKAVIPAAGMGTRFLPATKSQPKEMLPVVDTPAIQLVVEEAVAAGLVDICVVTGRGKRAIEDHFDRNFELDHYLEISGKHDLIADVERLSEVADLHYIRQRDPLGLGHAVAVAREHVGTEPFAVLLGDDIMVDDARLLREMIKVHERTGASVLALEEVAPSEISSYGAVGVEALDDGLVKVTSIVEKPTIDEAPSNFAVIGRYLFSSKIFEALERITPGRGGELQLTDAIALLLESEDVLGVVFSGGRHDMGNKAGFLRANVELALERPDLGPELEEFLIALLKKRGAI